MYNPTFDNSRYMNPNQNQATPYSDIQGAMIPEPQPMAGNMTESQLYPYANAPVYAGTPQANFGYAHGGRVRRSDRTDLPSLAEIIRREGNNEDSILAHINPIEAMLLKRMGGSGTINPRTGLPQFSFWNKPWKATRSSLGSIAGAVIGNMILPGIGGVIGGAIGQGTQHAARGKKFGEGALKGASIGAMLPGAASLAGMGANALGATGAGSALTNYGAQNSILASLGMKGLGSSLGFGEGASGVAGAAPMKEYALSNLTNNVVLPNTGGAAQGVAGAVDSSFLSKLGANSSNFFSKPQNLLALASAAGSMAGRKKEKTPEQLAREQKRYEQALMLTAEERAAKEADMLSNRQMQRRIERNSFLPEQRFAVNPIYRKAATPEEYRQTGKWLTYHNNPEFTGQPIMMKHGGRAQHPDIEIEQMEMTYPTGQGYLLRGHTGGQDDKIRNPIYEGDFILPADVVSHAGDGNTMAGGKNLDILFNAIKGKVDRPAAPIDAFLSDGEYVIRRDKVTALGKGNNALGGKKLDAFMKNIRKTKGADTRLPPKIKSLASYLTR